MDTSNDEITALIGALAVRVDAGDWSGLTGLFDAKVRVDYTSLFGGDAKVLSAEDLIASWRQLVPGFSHTSHLIGVPFVRRDGDYAHVSASVTAWHAIEDQPLPEGNVWTVHGCYEIDLVKVDGAWRIAALTLARAWAEGNIDLPKIAAERAQQ